MISKKNGKSFKKGKFTKIYVRSLKDELQTEGSTTYIPQKAEQKKITINSQNYQQFSNQLI